MSRDPRAWLRDHVQSDCERGRPERAFDRCTRAARDAPTLQERRYAARLVRSLAAAVPASARTHARRASAKPWISTWPTVEPRPGAVAFPTVRGGADTHADDCFVVARVTAVSGAEDHLPSGLEDDARASVTAALDAARQSIGVESRFRLTLLGPASWTGPSLGLAVAVAAVSAHRSLPVPDGVVASGRVRVDGSVSGVDQIAPKRALLAAARPRASMLVAPTSCQGDPRCVPVGSLAEAVAAATGADMGDPDIVLYAVRQAVRQGAWVEAARQAARLADAPHLEPDEQLLLLSVRLAAANHAGDAAAQRDLRPALDSALARGGVGPESVRALGNLAVSAVDRLSAADAHALADRALALLPHDGEHRLHAQGPKALAESLDGRFDAALALRRASLTIARRVAHTEVPRCLGDLSAALLRAGQEAEALAAAERGLDAARGLRRRAGYRDLTLPFLHYHHARALRAAGLAGAARLAALRAAEAPGLAPRLFAQLLIAELDRNRADIEAAWRDLPRFIRDTPVVGALFERSRAQLGDSTAAAALSVRFRLPLGSAAAAGRRLPY